MVRRLHGIVCDSIHRDILHDDVMKGCEDILHCRWVAAPPPAEIKWWEIDKHNGELDLWSEHGGTLVSVMVNSRFVLDGHPVAPEEIERMLAAVVAAKLHCAVWRLAIDYRAGNVYCIARDGIRTESAAAGEPHAEAWLKYENYRSNAASAVGEDEYVHGFIEAYRRRSVGGQHTKPVAEVEAGLRRDYRRALASYEGYTPDMEALFFEV